MNVPLLHEKMQKKQTQKNLLLIPDNISQQLNSAGDEGPEDVGIHHFLAAFA